MVGSDVKHMRHERHLRLADQASCQIAENEADHAVLLIDRDLAVEGLVLSQRMREHDDEAVERLGAEAWILWIRLGEEVCIERAHPREIGHLERADHASSMTSSDPGLPLVS